MLIWIGLALATVVLLIWALRRRANGEPFYALVILLREPRIVEASHVTGALHSAGVEGDLEREGPPAVRIGKTLLEVISAPVAYGTPIIAKEKYASGYRELHLREAFMEHEGFISVVVAEKEDVEDSVCLAARLVAELIDDSAIAVMATATGQLNLISPELVEEFRAGRAMEAMDELRHDGVTEVSGRDKRLRLAVAEAHRRWPEFVAAFEAASDREMFIAKGPFGDGTHTEWMWINVTGIEPSRISGILLNEPYKLRNVKEGDAVHIALEDLNDWLCPGPDGEPIGAFTEAIVRGG